MLIISQWWGSLRASTIGKRFCLVRRSTMIITVTLHPALDRILVAERLQLSTINRVQVIKEYGGGKGNNVARALHRLGVPVLAFGFQGGETGRIAKRCFRSENIATEFVSCRRPTRISTLLLERETGQDFTLYEPGQMVSKREMARLKERFIQHIAQCKVALFCGSAQSSALSHLLAELLTIAKHHQVVCIVDSSGQALRESILARPYMVKINQEELEELVGHRLSTSAELLEAMFFIQRQGISLVAITQGADGVVVTDGKVAWSGSLQVDRVINVMGCGDSLLAGMTWAFVQGLALPEIVRWGVACGAANTQVVGAGFIEQDLVNELLPKVQLTQLKT